MYMSLLFKADVSNEQQHSREIIADLRVAVHSAIVFTIVTEILGLCMGEARVKYLMGGR